MIQSFQHPDVDSIDQIANPLYHRENNPNVPEKFDAPVVAMLDAPVEPGTTEGERRRRRRHVLHRCAKSLVALAKAEFG